MRDYCRESGAEGVVYRFKNLFGKWSRPDYNSVTATFCHRIARDLPIEISDPSTVVDLTYIDDVIVALTAELTSIASGFRQAAPLASHRITLGDLAALIRGFRESRNSGVVPDMSEPFFFFRRCAPRFSCVLFDRLVSGAARGFGSVRSWNIGR